MKWPSETIQNLLFIWNVKTHVIFSIFILCYFIFSLMIAPGLCREKKLSSMKRKTKKTTQDFVFQKYVKFWIVWLGNFFKHKPLISEEWVVTSHQGIFISNSITRSKFKTYILKERVWSGPEGYGFTRITNSPGVGFIPTIP